jgi:hypothetical protein
VLLEPVGSSGLGGGDDIMFADEGSEEEGSEEEGSDELPVSEGAADEVRYQLYFFSEFTKFITPCASAEVIKSVPVGLARN